MNEPKFELLKRAYHVIESIPDNVIELHDIIVQLDDTKTCGTVCCAAGWLAHNPEFRAMGLGYEIRQEHDYAVLTLHGQTGHGAYSEVMCQFFGISLDDAYFLFAGRGEPGTDEDEDEPDENDYQRTDKQVWLDRMRNYLSHHGHAI